MSCINIMKNLYKKIRTDVKISNRPRTSMKEKMYFCKINSKGQLFCHVKYIKVLEIWTI